MLEMTITTKADDASLVKKLNKMCFDDLLHTLSAAARGYFRETRRNGRRSAIYGMNLVILLRDRRSIKESLRSILVDHWPRFASEGETNWKQSTEAINCVHNGCRFTFDQSF